MLNLNQFYEYHDMFNKYNIIKKINPHYKLCFDKVNKLFIIINSANNNEICLKFNNFSINIEKILQKTLVINSLSLFKEIENNNKNIEEGIIKNTKNKLVDSLHETQKYSLRTNKILSSDINKILGVKNV